MRLFQRFFFWLGLVLLPTVLLAEVLTLYSGRSRALVEPVIRAFERESGVQVNVRYGGSAQLALALQEEGRRSRADLFWAQDAGTLETLKARGLFHRIPEERIEMIYEGFRDPDGFWVATSSRARVLVYSPGRVSEAELPGSLEDLMDPRWHNRIGWAPANGSFQSFLSAWITLEGETPVANWLEGMKALRPRAYAGNNAILEAIAAGEIDIGLSNHYYLLRQQLRNADFPVRQRFFASGSPGNLLNFAGLGIVAASQRQEAALRFIAFMLAQEAQTHFQNEVFEYPVIALDSAEAGLVPFAELIEIVPQVRPVEFAALEQTLALLRRLALL